MRCLADDEAATVENSMNIWLWGECLVSCDGDSCDGGKVSFIPFALPINLVFAEGEVLYAVLAAALFEPAADVIVCCPPIELGDHEGGCGSGVNRQVVLIFMLAVGMVFGVVAIVVSIVVPIVVVVSIRI
jgi:hypothetical protein